MPAGTSTRLELREWCIDLLVSVCFFTKHQHANISCAKLHHTTGLHKQGWQQKCPDGWINDKPFFFMSPLYFVWTYTGCVVLFTPTAPVSIWLKHTTPAHSVLMHPRGFLTINVDIDDKYLQKQTLMTLIINDLEKCDSEQVSKGHSGQSLHH